VRRLLVAGGENDVDRRRGMPCRSSHHTVDLQCNTYRRGHFQTSNKIRIAANKLRMFKKNLTFLGQTPQTLYRTASSEHLGFLF